MYLLMLSPGGEEEETQATPTGESGSMVDSGKELKAHQALKVCVHKYICIYMYMYMYNYAYNIHCSRTCTD